MHKVSYFVNFAELACIVGSRGASQLGGSLLGIPLGYKANKLLVSLSYPVGFNLNYIITMLKSFNIKNSIKVIQ